MIMWLRERLKKYRNIEINVFDCHLKAGIFRDDRRAARVCSRKIAEQKFLSCSRKIARRVETREQLRENCSPSRKREQLSARRAEKEIEVFKVAPESQTQFSISELSFNIKMKIEKNWIMTKLITFKIRLTSDRKFNNNRTKFTNRWLKIQPNRSWSIRSVKIFKFRFLFWDRVQIDP